MKPILNSKLIHAINQANSVLLCTHLMPDGDAIGSVLALSHLFEQMGKNTFVVCQDPVPSRLRYLPGSERILLPEEVKGNWDLAVSIDISDRGRFGRCTELFFSSPLTAQLDHHATNTQFAALNEVDSRVPASSTLAWRLAHTLHERISPQMAACLYAGLSTDTGNFCFGSMSEETFEQMSDLMRSGLNLTDDARSLHLYQRVSHMRLLGRALMTMRLLNHGRICAMSISKSDFADCNATAEDGEKIVNHGLYMDGVEMAYLATETDDGVKFSLRCVEPHNVAEIAARFGGGGHILASGCLLKQSLQDALNQMDCAMSGAFSE